MSRALALVLLAGGCHAGTHPPGDLGTGARHDLAPARDLPSVADLAPAGDLALPPLAPPRPLGVNMPYLLFSYLGTAVPAPAQQRLDLASAHSHGFSFARFAASPFWPAQMRWPADKSGYFSAFDTMVDDARRRGMRLVPSLLFFTWLFPDLAHEPRGMLFTPGSKTRLLAEQFITEVVTRYRGSDAILFWEIGNEYGLEADLDYSACDGCAGAAPAGCPVSPSQGSPCKRTPADEFYSCNSCRGVSTQQQDLTQFLSAMATLIKGLDPTRGVSSGNSYPRPQASTWSATPCGPGLNEAGCVNFNDDTPAQFETALVNQAPDPIDILSVHHYPGNDAARFGDSDLSGVPLLSLTAQLAKKHGKTLYVGELGEPGGTMPGCPGKPAQSCGGDPARRATARVLDALVAGAVPYASYWAYLFAQECAGVYDCFSSADSDPIVASLEAHGRSFGACAGLADGAACPIGQCAASSCVANPPAPPLATPTTLATWTFGGAAGLNGWTVFTNCTACTPGTFTNAAGYAQLVAHDLPCSGACQYPGVYAYSPSVAANPGHLTIQFSARASALRPAVVVEAFDGANAQIVQGDANVDPGVALASSGMTVTLPPATVSAKALVQITAPNGTLDVATVSLQWQP